MNANISKETIWYFHCPTCAQGWRVNDYRDDVIYCPKCHQQLQIVVNKYDRMYKAERTLTLAGYTDCGGELWKPPLGKSRDTIRDEALEEAAAELAKCRTSDCRKCRFYQPLDNVTDCGGNRVRALKSKP